MPKQTKQKVADTAASLRAEVAALKTSRYTDRVSRLAAIRRRAVAIGAADLVAEIELNIGEICLRLPDWHDIPNASRYRKLAQERREQLAVEKASVKAAAVEAVARKNSERHLKMLIPFRPTSQPYKTIMGEWHDEAGYPTRYVTGVDHEAHEKRCKRSPVEAVTRAMINEALRDLAKRDLEARTPKPPPPKPPGGFPVVDEDDGEHDGRHRGDGGWTMFRIRRAQRKRAAA